MKKLFTTLLALTLVFSLGVMSVSAATTSTKDTDASIVLTEGEVTIVDPEETPEDPDSEYAGVQTMNMDFGTHQITGVTETYPGIKTGSQTDELPEGIKEAVGFLLIDARGQENATWNVKTAISKFSLSDDNAKETLKGFDIRLAPVAGSLVGPAAQLEPTQHEITLEAAEDPITIFESDATGSMGKWGANWDTEMTIIGGTETQAAHAATVTWTIEAVPALGA